MPCHRPIRLAFALLLMFCTLPAVPLRLSAEEVWSDDRGSDDESSEPYVVYVAQAEAFARCGPSGEHYRTDPLRHGQRLEVYVETADGWLGIRPPDDSFSWILADGVELSAGGEAGTVIEDRAVSWIGTHLGRARRYRWQVQLPAGEPVAILGRSERDGPDGPQLWYRIVPPSGEFRWVHRDQVVETPEQLVASSMQTAAGAGDVRAARDDVPDGSPLEFLPGAIRRAASIVRDRAEPQTNPDGPAAGFGDEVHDAPIIGSGLRPGFERGSLGPSKQVSTAEQSAPQVHTAVDAGAPSQSDPPSQIIASSGTATQSASDMQSTAAFLSRPRVQSIDGGELPPRSGAEPDDGNWVSGLARESQGDNIGLATGTAGHVPQAVGNGVQPVSGQAPMPPHWLTVPAGRGSQGSSSSTTLTPTTAPLLRSLRTVSAEAIAAVEEEIRSAPVERLQLVFSRLVADRVSSAEVAPVFHAATELASTAEDEITAGRARLLAERVEQYQRIARRRDGDTVVQTSPPPILPPRAPASMLVPADALETASGDLSASAGGPTLTGDSGSGVAGEELETGTLVAVYSVRKQSPPFVLIDRSGQTLAYVTPAPGVDMRSHLNSRIRVRGKRGYLEGINTPHLFASAVERVPEF